MNCGGVLAEPLNWLTIWHSVTLDLAESIGEAQLLGNDLDRDLAEADLAGERMRAGVAALSRIAERQQEALVAARQRLQPHVAPGRETRAARA